jgi:hypothetical protein
MYASRTWRSFLCSRSTLIRLFHCYRGLCGRFTLRRDIGRALDHERWSLTAPATADQYAEQQNPDRQSCTLQQMCSPKPRQTLVAKPATGPRAPAQTHDPLTTLRTEIWTVIREERQSPCIIGDLIQATESIAPASEISTFEKLSGAGHTLQADYHAIPEIRS